MRSPALAAQTALAALVLLAACNDKPKVTPEEPATKQAAAPSAAGSKEGPTPADPLLANQSPMPLPPLTETKPLANASNAFAFDLWARTSKRPGNAGNAAFSPASISIAVAMAWLGSKSDTSAQIKKTMHFEGTPEVTAASWGKLSSAFSSPPRAMTLRIANRLFGEKTYKFEQPYLDETKRDFGAPLELVDFKTAFDPARLQINHWVEEQTEKRIVDLLPTGALDERTRLVLVNAIYFLADWADPFSKNATKDAPFEVSAAVKKDVPTMHRRGRYALAQGDGAKVLELPYKGGDASMIVVLPDQKDGLPAIEKLASAAKLEAWRKAASPSEVDVALPRFEVSPPTMSLADELIALGMPLAFDKVKADFTGIGKPADPTEHLYIAKAFHKAFVKVDEKGTEAAAATALSMGGGGGAPPKAIEFHADHPFLFFIVEQASGLVLFMGRVADPSTK